MYSPIPQSMFVEASPILLLPEDRSRFLMYSFCFIFSTSAGLISATTFARHSSSWRPSHYLITCFSLYGILLSPYLLLQVWSPSDPAPLQCYIFFHRCEAFALHSEGQFVVITVGAILCVEYQCVVILNGCNLLRPQPFGECTDVVFTVSSSI